MIRDRALKLMQENGLDCLVGTSTENVRYLTGFGSFLKGINPLTPVFGILPAEKSATPVLVTGYSEADVVASRRTTIGSVRFYGDFPLVLSDKNLSLVERNLLRLSKQHRSPEPVAAVTTALKELGAGSSKIGIDETGLPYGMFEKIASELGGGVVPAAQTLRKIRSVKTEEEIASLRKVVGVTEAAMESSMKEAKPGSTTSKIIRVVDAHELADGARPLFTVVGSRNLSAFPNALGDDEKLRNGDLVRYDVGCSLEGYCSDLGRTVAVGRPPPKQANLYEATLAGLEAALDHVRPGAKASEVFNAAVEEVRRKGIGDYRRHHTGHGIGMEVYDPPMISAADDTILEEGMVINLETPYYELGVTGLIVEDCLVVRRRGYELLSKLNREL